MRPRETRDGIEKDDDILLVLHEALGFLDHHLRDLDVPIGRLVERRADHFAAHVPLHVRDFFGPLVDEEYDEMHFRMILVHGGGDFLEQNRLPRARRRDDQSALSLADRRDEIHDAHADVAVLGLQPKPAVGIARAKIVEGDALLGELRLVIVDRLHLEEREIALPFLRWTHLTRDSVSRAQIESFRTRQLLQRVPRDHLCLVESALRLLARIQGNGDHRDRAAEERPNRHRLFQLGNRLRQHAPQNR